VLLRVAKLAAELLQAQAMLCHSARAKKNHWNVPPVPFAQHRIVVNIHFAEARAELAQKRRNRSLCLLAEMTPRSGVKRHFARTGGSQTRVFRMKFERQVYLPYKLAFYFEKTARDRTGA
jgi:hypothetical protein